MPVGHLKEVGFKFGRWLDVIYMELVLEEGKQRESSQQSEASRQKEHASRVILSERQRGKNLAATSIGLIEANRRGGQILRSQATFRMQMVASSDLPTEYWLLPALHVQILHFQRVLLDELPAALDVFAHQHAEHPLGLAGFLQRHAQQHALGRDRAWFPTAARCSSRPGP